MYLGIDPFIWSETHARRPDLPRLKYHWKLEEIQLDTTPWVEKKSGASLLRTRKDGPQTLLTVARTNAWNDDNGRGDYVLWCRVLGLAP